MRHRVYMGNALCVQTCTFQGQSPRSVQSVMQLYTRVVILALEVMTVEGLLQPRDTTPRDNSPSGIRETSAGTGQEVDDESVPDNALTVSSLGYTTTFLAGMCALPARHVTEYLSSPTSS